MINNIRKLFLIAILLLFAGCGQKNETNISDSTEIRMDTEKEKITLPLEYKELSELKDYTLFRCVWQLSEKSGFCIQSGKQTL